MLAANLARSQKTRAITCRLISPSSPSSEPLRLQKPTVLTVPLSLECCRVSMFHPQLCIDAEIRQDCDGKASKIASESTTRLRLFSSEKELKTLYLAICLWPQLFRVL